MWVRHGLQDIQTAAHALERTWLQYDTQQTITRDLQREVSTLETQLRELKSLIAQEGLQNLEKRINTLLKARSFGGQRYSFTIRPLDEEGKVIDRRNKSLGSGGEQAVPNYLLILIIAHFMYRGKKMRLHTVLDKIAQRYSKRDRLSGRMKLGTALDHATLILLHQYFGVAPLRINTKEETHLDFDRLLNEATQA